MSDARIGQQSLDVLLKHRHQGAEGRREYPDPAQHIGGIESDLGAHPQLGGGDHVVLTVRDTGEGIAAEDLDKIFNAFYTTRERGTGLGLAITKRQIELMGGELTLVSTPEDGACFAFSLPLPPAEGPVASARATTHRLMRLPGDGQVTALVVDDVDDNREVLRQLAASEDGFIGLVAGLLQPRDRRDHRKTVR